MKKYIIVLITASIIILLISSTAKREDLNQKQIETNKNYAFCIGLYTLNSQYNASEYNRNDGSIEVFFIDSLLVLDTETTRIFVENYFDSLNRVGAYKSGLNKNLNIAKCLDMYNSNKLDKYVKQKIIERRNE